MHSDAASMHRVRVRLSSGGYSSAVVGEMHHSVPDHDDVDVTDNVSHVEGVE